ncbi:MAG: Rpn family recombination-promoting nuclease/putative transposase [Spirochaetales bacterium]|nr:Rpn family recombination-promoting nuclease/putative transposase [Spirochaetales bacterium]
MKNDNDWKKQFSPEILKAAEEAIEAKRKLSLTSDVVLKIFFTSDLPESNYCLRKFIGAVIGRAVTEAKVINPELPPSYKGDKSSRLDINCTLENGDRVDVEMQCTKENDDQRERALYYGGKLVSTALKKGRPYKELKKSYQIMITNYKEFDDDEFFTDFQMYSVKKKITLSDREKIIFIELPKLKKLLKCDFETLSALQLWAIMLKYNQNKQIMERLRDTSKFQEDNKMADMVLDHISEDLHTWAVNLSREKFERDRISSLTYAREKGLKKGLKKGLEKGRKQGMKKGLKRGIAEGSHSAKLETARNFLRMGFPAEKVAEGTGLSVEEIQNLK